MNDRLAQIFEPTTNAHDSSSLVQRTTEVTLFLIATHFSIVSGHTLTRLFSLLLSPSLFLASFAKSNKRTPTKTNKTKTSAFINQT
jgi:hypothetical protein